MEPKSCTQLTQEWFVNSSIVSPAPPGADVTSTVTENPLLGRPYRAMSKRHYLRLLQDIFERFPWLSRCDFEPSPGHLALTWAFLLDVEKLKLDVVPSEDNPRGQISIPLRTTLAGSLLPRRHQVVFDGDFNSLMKVFLDQMAQFCMVCGAPCSRVAPSPRCRVHGSRPAALFAEHFRGVGQGKSRAVEAVTEGAVGSPNDMSQPHIRLLDLRAAQNFHDQLAEKQKGGERANVLMRIEEAGGEYRGLQVLPPAWEALLDEMERGFPNFALFVDMLRDQFALAALGNGVLRLPPVLFAGEPGIGKTEVVKWLSSRLSVPFVSVDMACAQSGAELAGTAAVWGNTKPGKVFNTLIGERLANPLFLLDELDKVGGDERFEPLGSLYSLLERSSAAHFTDQSIEKFSIDASHINWIATANSLETLPAPVLSRFCVLEIPSPDQGQATSIARIIYRGLLGKHAWGGHFDPELTEAVLATLSLMPPRRMKMALEGALGRAARARRRVLIESDISLVSVERKLPFGFMSAVEGQGS